MPRITGSPTQITTEVPTPAALALMLCSGLHQGDEAWVDSLGKVFFLDRTSTATPNGTSVIATSDGTGNWVVSPEYSNRLLYLVTPAAATPLSVSLPTASQDVMAKLVLPSSFLPQAGDICLADFTFGWGPSQSTSNTIYVYTMYTDPGGSLSFGGPTAPTKGTLYENYPDVFSGPTLPSNYQALSQSLVITPALAASIAAAVASQSPTYAGFGVQLSCDISGGSSTSVIINAASLRYYRP